MSKIVFMHVDVYMCHPEEQIPEEVDPREEKARQERLALMCEILEENGYKVTGPSKKTTKKDGGK
jgi:hypothetical protein